MKNLAFWFYREFRDHNYVQSLTLVALLLLYVLISALSISFYGLLYGLNNLPVIAQTIAGLTIFALIALLFKTKKPLIIGYISAILYTAHIYITTLYGMPDTHQVNMFWFAITPGFVVFRKSVVEIITVEILLGLIMLELQCHIAGVTTLTGALQLFATHPELVMTLVIVLLFSLGCAFMLLFMMQVYEDNHKTSQYDHLTGLFNRHVLDIDGQYVFQRFKDSGEAFYIIFSDLDRFKEINDLFGHDTGDKVLREVGNRLRKIRETINQRYACLINVYRFGGDEFLFLLSSVADREDLEAILQTISTTIKAPYPIDNRNVEVGLSVGVAKSNAKAVDFEELIRFADIIMYANKREGKLNFHGPQPDRYLEQWRKKFDIYKDMQQALEKNQFRLVYQPLYCAKSLRMIGCEALLRWDSDFNGEIFPDEFISVAEATGMIQQLSLWTIRRALKQAEAWLAINPDLIISINISPYQLRDNSFIKKLHELLEKSNQLKLTKNIEFEVTETASITHSGTITHILHEIRNMGIQLALDDYGQGNTSFLNLQQAAFRVIKLDKRLLWEATHAPENSKVIKAAINSAHSLGLQVTAEGVETQAHLNMAVSLGCNILQGYLFSRPVDAAEIDGMLHGIKGHKRCQQPCKVLSEQTS